MKAMKIEETKVLNSRETPQSTGYREELSPEDTSTLDLDGTLIDERPKSRPDTPSSDRSSSTDNTDTASRTGNSSK